MTTRTPWRSRIVGNGEACPDELLPNARNWRRHPKRQTDALEGVLSEVGWVQQVIVNQRTGQIVDGHARVERAVQFHEPTVPVVYVDLSEAEEAVILATFDPLGAMAETDRSSLDLLLADVTVDDDALRALLGDLGSDDLKAGLTDPDEVPETPEEPYVSRASSTCSATTGCCAATARTPTTWHGCSGARSRDSWSPIPPTG